MNVESNIVTTAVNLDANGLRVRVWLLWDQRNCVLRVTRVVEVIGPNGVNGDVDAVLLNGAGDVNAGAQGGMGDGNGAGGGGHDGVDDGEGHGGAGA